MPIIYTEKCNKKDLHKDLIKKLDLLDKALKIDIYATSGLRDPIKNESVGGVKNSAHLRGYAIDFSCNNSSLRYTLMFAGLLVGFNRFGLSIKRNDHIHMDCDPDKPKNVVWYED